jgi:hypothetical protein
MIPEDVEYVPEGQNIQTAKLVPPARQQSEFYNKIA